MIHYQKLCPILTGKALKGLLPFPFTAHCLQLAGAYDHCNLQASNSNASSSNETLLVHSMVRPWSHPLPHSSHYKGWKSFFPPGRLNSSSLSLCRHNAYIIQSRNFRLTSIQSESESNLFSQVKSMIFGVSDNEIREVVVPQLAESLSEGDIRWAKGKQILLILFWTKLFSESAVGDAVEEDEVVGEVETDKTSVPIHSPCAGVIEELLAEDGSTVEPGKVVLRIRVGATGAAKPAAAAAKSETPKQESVAVKEEAKPEPAVASAPKPAKVASIPVAEVKSAAASLAGDAASSTFGSRNETRVKMSRMRTRIAERLKGAQNTYAMLTTFNEIDMRYAVSFCQSY